MAAMSGNDATAVTSYAINGATAGYGQLWLMLLTTPMYQAVEYSCSKIGRTTRVGLDAILRAYYSRWVAVLAALILIITNIGLIAGNLVAIGSGFELITGIFWIWFVIPAAIFLWYITVFSNFNLVKKIFIVMSAAFITYIITAFISGADWKTMLIDSFVPRITFNFADITAALALIGAALIVIPIMSASSAYAVADTFGWPAGLSEQPWQAEGFYIVLTVSLLVGMAFALLRVDPIKLSFYANVFTGVLAPVMVIYLMAIGNSRKIMGEHKLGWLTNFFLAVTALVLVAGSVLFFYGLATGS